MKTTPLIRRFLATSALAFTLPLSAMAQQSAPTAADPRPPMSRHHDQRGHHRHHGQHGPQHQGGPLYMLRELNLSAEQQTQMKALADSHRQSTEASRQAMQTARAELSKLVASDKYTPEAAGKLASNIASKESALILATAEQRNKMFQLLTPEQRSKLQTRMQEKGATPGSRR